MSKGDKAMDVPRNTPLIRPASRLYNGRWCHHAARLSSTCTYGWKQRITFIWAGFNLSKHQGLGTLTKTGGHYSMPLRDV
jgi:hypothetical protein